MAANDDVATTRALLQLMEDFLRSSRQAAFTSGALLSLVRTAQTLLNNDVPIEELLGFFQIRIGGFVDRLDEYTGRRSFKTLVEDIETDAHPTISIINEKSLDALCPTGPEYPPLTELLSRYNG